MKIVLYLILRHSLLPGGDFRSECVSWRSRGRWRVRLQSQRKIRAAVVVWVELEDVRIAVVADATTRVLGCGRGESWRGRGQRVARFPFRIFRYHWQRHNLEKWSFNKKLIIHILKIFLQMFCRATLIHFVCFVLTVDLISLWGSLFVELFIYLHFHLGSFLFKKIFNLRKT